MFKLSYAVYQTRGEMRFAVNSIIKEMLLMINLSRTIFEHKKSGLNARFFCEMRSNYR